MQEINLQRWAILVSELFHSYVITLKASTQAYLNEKYDNLNTWTLVWATD